MAHTHLAQEVPFWEEAFLVDPSLIRVPYILCKEQADYSCRKFRKLSKKKH
jgi:hypothetical protein